MDSFFIKTQDIDKILYNSDIYSEYFNVYQESFDKTRLFFNELNLKGILITSKELFLQDEYRVRSLLEEALESKQNIVAYNYFSTLFIYIAEENSINKDIFNEQNLIVDDLIDLVESDFDFNKINLNEEIAYNLSSVREFCMSFEKLNKNRINKFLLSGVFIKNPSNVQIDSDVSIEPGAIIGSGTIIKGCTHIAKGVIIEENVKIVDSKIGKNSKIECSSIIVNSVIEESVTVLSSKIKDSYVDCGTSIGPYAQLRPNTKVGKNVKIGNFVELKNSKIGNNTKISHLSYVGDSDLGMNINVGCGVVFVNYNGFEKFRSVIEDDVFIGCNANIVSPIKIGKGAFIAAGSTVTEDVMENQLSIARTRQINKDGWKLKK